MRVDLEADGIVGAPSNVEAPGRRRGETGAWRKGRLHCELFNVAGHTSYSLPMILFGSESTVGRGGGRGQRS